MADHWYSSMSSGSVITHVNWNEMVDDCWCQGGISGSYVGHSSNTTTAHGLDSYAGNASLTTVGTIGTGEWNGTAIEATYIGSHSNTQHDNNYYYQESDLTAVLNDNYPGSSNVNKNYLDNVSSNAKTAYDERGSQIAGDNLSWDGSQLNAAAGGGGSGGYPSGQDGAIQFASGGAHHGGDHRLIWDRYTPKLVVSGNIRINDTLYTDKIESHTGEDVAIEATDDIWLIANDHITLSATNELNIRDKGDSETWGMFDNNERTFHLSGSLKTESISSQVISSQNILTNYVSANALATSGYIYRVGHPYQKIRLYTGNVGGGSIDHYAGIYPSGENDYILLESGKAARYEVSVSSSHAGIYIEPTSYQSWSDNGDWYLNLGSDGYFTITTANSSAICADNKGYVGIGDVDEEDINYQLQVNGSVSSQSVTASGLSANILKHIGDDDTYIKFGNDSINLVCGDYEVCSADDGVFCGNPNGNNMGFQWDAEESSVLFCIKPVEKLVGIRIEEPLYPLHVMGAISAQAYSGNKLKVTTVSCSTYEGPSTVNMGDFVASNTALSKFYPSTLGNGISSNVKTLDDWYRASAQNLSKAYASAQLATYDGGDSLGSISWETPTASSGLSTQGGGMVSGTLTFFIDDYIASSNVIANTVASSTAITKFLISSEFSGWRNSVTTTEMDYLHGVTSDIQTQIDDITVGNAVTYWSSQVNKSVGSIYYGDGEVVVAPSGTDYGSYRFQVSGASYFSGNVQFIGELSSMADPTYASGAANKHYVDTVSGALSSRIEAIGGLDGATISSNFFYIYSGNTLWSWYEESGVKLYNISTSIQSKFLLSGVVYNAISSNKISSSSYKGLIEKAGITIDGGGGVIPSGIKGDSYIPYDCKLSKIVLTATPSGSIYIDIWKDTIDNFPPTVVDSITGEKCAFVSSNATIGIISSNNDLTNWTTSISDGDILRYYVSACTTVQRCTMTLILRRT